MSAAAAPGADAGPDPRLGALAEAVPDLTIGPAEHVRVALVLTALVDRGAAPGDGAALARIVAPLVARTTQQQDAVHAFYGGPGSEPEPAEESRDPAPEPAPDRRRRPVLWIAAAAAMLVLAAALTLLSGIPLTGPGPEVEIVQPGGVSGDLPAWAATVAGWLIFLLSGIGELRGVLVAVPLSLTAWLVLRLLHRSAVLDPELSSTEAEAPGLPVPSALRDWLFSAPQLTRELGRLRLHRTIRTRRPDARRTAELTARSSGHLTRIVTEVRSRAVEHLVLIDRPTLSDHLGLLGDALVDRLVEAGVPTHAYDLLRNAERASAPGLPLTGEEASVQTRTLALTFHRDATVIVAEAGRLLDASGRRLAPWAARFAETGMLALLTPIPPASWGVAERRLADLGVDVFPVSEAGVAAYVAHRVATVEGGAPEARPAPSPPAPGWTLGEAVRAVARADEDDAADRARAVYALRAALGPAAFRLLGVLSLFPVVLPGLTLRMRPAFPEVGVEAIATLCALPGMREGRLPFWLRVDLVRALAPGDRARARAVIRDFQDELDPGAAAEVPLGVVHEEDGLVALLRALGRRTAGEITRDALFVRFMRGDDDLSGLTGEATGLLRDRIAPARARRVAGVGAAGLAMAAATWVAAPAAIAAVATGAAWFLSTVPVLGEPVARTSLIVAALILYTLRLALFPDAGRRTGWRARVGRWIGIAPLVPLAVHALATFVLLRSPDLQTLVVVQARPSPGADFAFGGLVLFLLLALSRRRPSVPLDLFARSAQLSVPGLLGTAVVLVVAIASGLGMTGDFPTELSLLFGACWLIGTVLATLLLWETRADWGDLAAAGGLFVDVATLTLLGAAAAGAGTLLSELAGGTDPQGVPMASLFLFPLLPLLARYGIVGWRGWIAGLGAACLLLWAQSGLSGGVASVAGPLAPALAIMIAGVFVFHGHMAPAKLVARWGTALALTVAVGVLVGAVSAPLGAQDVPADCPGPGCPELDIQQTAPRDVPTPADDRLTALPGPVLEAPVIVEEAPASPGLFGSGYGLIAAYLATVAVTGQWLWLRHAARHRGAAGPLWSEGRMAAVLAVLPLMLLGLSIRWTGDWAVSGLALLPLVAIWLARFGHWMAVAVVAATLPMIGQTGIAADTLFGGLGLPLFVLIVLLVRMVAERGFLGRLLALDTIRWRHVAVVALLYPAMLVYERPEIALRIVVGVSELVVPILLAIGLSRVPLRIPMIAVLGLGALSLVAEPLLGPRPAGGLVLWVPVGAHVFDLAWSLVLMAIVRAARMALLRDLGDDPVARDGPIMGRLVLLGGSPLFLAGLAALSIVQFEVSLFGVSLPFGIGGPFPVAVIGLLASGLRVSGIGTAGQERSMTMALVASGAMIGAVFVWMGVSLSTGIAGPVAAALPGGSVSVSMLDLQPSYPLFAVVALLAGYLLGRGSQGLRRSAMAEPRLWVPEVPPPARTEKAGPVASSDADRLGVGSEEPIKAIEGAAPRRRPDELDPLLPRDVARALRVARGWGRGLIARGDILRVEAAAFRSGLIPPGWQAVPPPAMGIGPDWLDPTPLRLARAALALVFAGVLLVTGLLLSAEMASGEGINVQRTIVGETPAVGNR